MKKLTTILLIAVVSLAVVSRPASAQHAKYDRAQNLDTPEAIDQDDMCVWVHPTDPSKSTVISSDKSGRNLIVYDFNGAVVESLTVSKPGNIDIAYGFPLAGKKVDIVAFNDRGGSIVQIFKVDPDSRKLTRVDDGKIVTKGGNYGFALYKSPVSQKYYAFTSPDYRAPAKFRQLRQFELSDNGNGKISGTLVRKLTVYKQKGKNPGDLDRFVTIEGMVADNEMGQLYIGEEGVGIRKYNAEPDGGSEGALIRTIADDPLENDVEGLTLCYLPDGEGYIVACSQLDSKEFKAHFDVFERKAPHKYVTSFMLTKVGETDGIDLCSANLGDRFPKGIFVAHNASENKQLVIVDWGKIAEGEKLKVDPAYGDPRKATKE